MSAIGSTQTESSSASASVYPANPEIPRPPPGSLRSPSLSESGRERRQLHLSSHREMVQQARHRSLQETPQRIEPLPESLEPAIAPRSTCPREPRTRSSRSPGLSPFRSNSCRSRPKDSVAKSKRQRLEVHERAGKG